METVLDQYTQGDIDDLISDFKVVVAGCQAHVGQLVSSDPVHGLGGAETELRDAFVNAMRGARDIESLLLFLVAMKRQAPADMSVQ